MPDGVPFKILMEKWVIAAKKADFKKTAELFHIDQVTARLIRNRDVVGEEAIRRYLHGNISELPSWKSMKGIAEAVDILKDKIRMGRRVRIIGDYDIDGVTASYILQNGLKRVGARADVVIPDRITDGYGINESLIADAAQDGIDTIVTCDNGIAAAAQIQTAKDLGLTVIVTDHHEVPYIERENGKVFILPPADVVINPRQEGCDYPFKQLCGACVGMQLVSGLYDGFGIDEKEIEEFLEFAAIATIGDVMDLAGDNRILVKEGMNRLRHTKNMGLLALIEANGLVPEQLSPYHIGFVIGPCLNAGGRLDTARRSLALLNAETQEEAVRLAADLKALNDERKDLTEQGVARAVEMVENSSLSGDRVLVVYLPECHESLAGIIAGRLRERYHKPSIVLTRTQEGVKGSGRSIEAYSMYEELVKVKDLLIKFGGHPMAAGLSLEEANVPGFRKRLNELCTLREEDLAEKVVIDAAMPIGYIRKDLVQEFELLEPFGKGNTRPLFALRQVRMLECRIFGKNRNVVKMKVMDDQGYSIDGVYFGDGDSFVNDVKDKGRLNVVYYPSVNSYRGKENLQVVITHYQ
ncbi:single-stranded-DNA-specific exonuclease RecJ [Ruminococcus sp. OA3]|uniref:single-stranded-DNA-specific exonuclease RecJ n=1 Tax=Ruminococcus sp. OA3 TaxID=2914164 RepID=UPI0031F4FD50